MKIDVHLTRIEAEALFKRLDLDEIYGKLVEGMTKFGIDDDSARDVVMREMIIFINSEMEKMRKDEKDKVNNGKEESNSLP
jgi:hypothetical protein